MLTDITSQIKNVFPPQEAIDAVLDFIEDIADICIIFKLKDGEMGQVTSDMTHTQALGFCEVGKQITMEEMKEG